MTDIKAYGISEEELLRLAAEVEVTSEHHLGKTIVKKAEEKGLILHETPSDVEILNGHGIRTMLNGNEIYIGNLSGAKHLGIKVHPEKETYLIQQQKKGNTSVLVLQNDKTIGVISIADQIRKEASAALQELREIGIRQSVMLTGDNKSVADKVGAQLGIDQVFAELLPQDKVDKVSACMESGMKLAMVGDGINDAPAIATADVGIAMRGTGTDVTMQTADIILMSDKLDNLPYAIRLARATVRNMKQNTYFALITVAFLLAGVLTDKIHLASGMLIHEISVILVILNAVRLVRYPKYQLPWNMPKIMKKPEKEGKEIEIHYADCAV